MLKKIWEIIEDIAGRNDKEKEQDAIKVQQNVEDFISNAKANFNDNYSKIINSKENMSNSITSNNLMREIIYGIKYKKMQNEALE